MRPTEAVFRLNADELGGLLEWHKAQAEPDEASIIQIKRAIEDIQMAQAYNARFHAIGEEIAEEGKATVQ